MVNAKAIEAWYRTVQTQFIVAIEEVDQIGRFGEDRWERPGGGGGITRILSDGRHIEKAACSFSAVFGETPARLSAGRVADRFYATGVSIIVHPRNPFAPTFHANLRYFESGSDAWFGGGADLTPHYLFEEDAAHFHRVLRTTCLRHPVAEYEKWKQNCDSYFFLSHRGERRGIGGLFFDHLDQSLDEVFALQRDLGRHALTEAYIPILHRRVDTPYEEQHRRWQEIRRGRYVEFNLLADLGTRFGLETGGRTESILASLPPRAAWDYDHRPEPGSAEAEMVSVLTGEPRDWR